MRDMPPGRVSEFNDVSSKSSKQSYFGLYMTCLLVRPATIEVGPALAKHELITISLLYPYGYVAKPMYTKFEKTKTVHYLSEYISWNTKY